MFSKTEQSKPKPAASSSGSSKGAKSPPSIVSRNLRIVGDLETDGEIQIDGSVEGNVASQSLTVGDKASICGEVVAGEVEIHGDVSGKIRAEKVKLGKTAKVIGDIWHEILSIEPGAHIEGQLMRAKKDSTSDDLPRVEVTATRAPKPAAGSAGDSAKAGRESGGAAKAAAGETA